MAEVEKHGKIQSSNHHILGMFEVITLASMLFAAAFLAMPLKTSFAQGGRPPTEQQQVPPTTGEKQDISLEGTSTEGSIAVKVNWTPADIGQPNTFSFAFADPDGNRVSPIYSIELLQSNQTVPGTLREEQTSMIQQYTFNETGSYMLKIHDIQDRRATDVIIIPLQVTSQPPVPTNNNASSSTSSGN